MRILCLTNLVFNLQIIQSQKSFLSIKILNTNFRTILRLYPLLLALAEKPELSREPAPPRLRRRLLLEGGVRAGALFGVG